MELGVCYYPEHWDEVTWAPDATRMRASGLSWVRVGEFAWSVLEPRPGHYEWGWLDRAVDTLAEAGLKVVLGTPTATPPKWLVDSMPDMLPVAPDGRRLGFGSRRHYDFAHRGYRDASAKVAADLAERYGRHEAVRAWQVDNEYGCHDSLRQAGRATRDAWPRWLEARYGTIQALNEAWWTTFWSMRYSCFEDVELPLQTVTEAAPGARLDYARFSSELAIAYHRRQVAEIRPRSPGRPVTHNAMLFFGDLDAHALGRELDAITWDNYPLGMLEMAPLPEELKTRFARTGHPDLIAFNHDLYRGALEPAAGEPYRPFWVMEQQPGQVNWAPTNPLPSPGAVRLWTHQALAHGADVVSYFRWRPALGAQEHMHAGLLRHDGTPDQGLAEAERVAAELLAATTDAAPQRRRAPVALLFSYHDLWAGEIQPHAAGWAGWGPWLHPYLALRSLGLDVDVLPPDRDLRAYSLVIAPSLTLADEALEAALERALSAATTLLLGPRSGAYRNDMRVHEQQPGPLGGLSGTRVARVDTLRPGSVGLLTLEPALADAMGSSAASYHTWADLLEPSDSTHVWARYATPAYAGVPALTCREHERGARCLTLGAALDSESWGRLLHLLASQAGLSPVPLPDGVRLSQHAGRPCLQNFRETPAEVDLRPLGGGVVSVPEVGVVWPDLPG